MIATSQSENKNAVIKSGPVWYRVCHGGLLQGNLKKLGLAINDRSKYKVYFPVSNCTSKKQPESKKGEGQWRVLYSACLAEPQTG